VLNETLAAITGILVLAALSEALVEYLFAPIVDARAPDETMQPEPSANRPAVGLDWRALALRYVSVLIGVALCFVYQVDLLVYFNLSSPWPWVGYLVTGILIGRGSNFVHDFAGRWLQFQQVE
jgi:hypothetical protein